MVLIVHKSDIYNLDSCIEDFFTNELLYRMKIVDSPECPLCNYIPDTIEHAFIECQKIHTLWRHAELCLDMALKEFINISDTGKNIWYYL